ncbi:GATA zinc finger domain-containing protein 7 [Colletotrichum trifolii]|uniref:GATA zinc finger domain-containing protein 7 n=1 Tax=Colletotrichum trifolii TaxID=5466 RepID=A0A4R8QSD0_COLTR|nr:GATA zinc finger domain-containing protein 7 [Colletotrichum trifolii]
MPSGPKGSRSVSPPRSESSRRRRDAASASASASNAASDNRGDLSSDSQFDSATPPRLSLNHLKQGESHQRIRHGAKQLLRLTEHFPGYNGPGPEGGYETANDHALPSESDLRAMTRLSHSIARDINEIRSLRKDNPGSHKRKGSQQQQTAMDVAHILDPEYASPPGRNRNRRKVEYSCHKCHRVDTPEWRSGPDGPSTLCNVCGLIYAKRERKKEESALPTSGSPHFS